MSTVLGIDPSLTATGIVLLVDGEVRRAEVWATKLRGEERLAHLDDALQAALSDACPDHVAIEGYSFASTGRSLISLGELGGVYRLGVWRMGYPLTEIPPGVWRKQLLGKGNLAKDAVRVEVLKRHGFEHASLDVIEAYCVAMCLHRQQQGMTTPEPIRRGRSAA